MRRNMVLMIISGSYARGISPYKVLTMDSINENIVKMKYAVRGPLLQKSSKIIADLAKGVKKPFKEVIMTNLGNPQAMGQPPITFIRQMVATTLYKDLLNDECIPCDVRKRANEILHDTLGESLGSYTHSQGIQVIRQHVANYIMKRDGECSTVDPEDIFLSDGASSMIKTILSLYATEDECEMPTGCLLSVPQYPLYSASTTAYGLRKIDYYLDESENWGLSIAELKRAINEAKDDCIPRFLVIINPGNPTGQVLTKENIEDTIKFAYEEKLLILADEVYQDNIYDEDSEFHSIKKVMVEMGEPYSNMELISFNSASKGYAGECGFRGGYAEFFNIDKNIKDMIIKMVSVMLCPNAVGQIILDGIICPPIKGDLSYRLYMEEKEEILDNLATKAEKITEMLNDIDGIECNTVQGALYAFPKIKLPKKFIKEARKNKRAGDEEFCMQFLDAKGVTVIPGTGFGQVHGTYHFRTTILPPLKKLEYVVSALDDFYEKIKKKYN
ncbi:alanine aminotransferase 1-like [Lycorma delicatula]|uniref:alanine aminotransferase 1-like n=1 Tax=Lycorma delicatula TaxID=130591 RepID=UPI003F5135B6